MAQQSLVLPVHVYANRTLFRRLLSSVSAITINLVLDQMLLFYQLET